jgi:trimeric autotransporter adhesin
MKIILSSRRSHYAAAISMLSVVLAIAGLMAGTVGCGGGSAIEIRTWNNLSDVRNNLTSNYILMNDLDRDTPGYQELASPTANEGKGWDPIAGEELGNVFYGTFDGNGHKICDLFINRPDEESVALFGIVGQGALLKGTIKNVGLVNCTVTGDGWVGGLVGGTFMENTVANCYVTGTVTGTEYVGGLMATTAYGSTVTMSHFSGNVTGISWVGGLVGASYGGTVSNCYATGSVTGNGAVGGLVGISRNDTTVTDCHATGSVTGGGAVGGLSGVNDGIITHAYSTGNVTGFSWQVGGLMGSGSGNVSDSYSTGSVTGTKYVGGLAGTANTVSNCYATGNVTGDEVIGGLVGWHIWGTVSKCYATGSVAGNYSGGLVGVNGDTYIKYGLVELNDNDTVAIYYSYSTGSVTGSICVGGLVGENYLDTAVVSCSYSTGSVAGSDNMTGGLVGFNAGNVNESYSTGSVAGNDCVGGLVGSNEWGNVSDSYSTGSVAGNSSVGGLVGGNGYTVSNSFWDTQTSAQNVSAGGTGKTTAEMKNIATFSGAAWDIIAVANPSIRNTGYGWNIVDGATYPFLSWQPV